MTARWITADVFDGLATLEDGSVDLVVTSPPFLALRSYLPADHPDKHKEIGSEATPAEFIDVLLRVTAELRRVLAPHGSICVELGDTYAGSGGGGGDYLPGGWREGQQQFAGSEASMRESNAAHWRQKNQKKGGLANYSDARGNPDGMRDPTFSGANTLTGAGAGWPLAKSRTLIPQLYEIALAYGINPLTGQPSPAGQWRIRNVVTWARPNPPVGALGDKWRPATSDLIVACTSSKRYWDDLATRRRGQPSDNDKDFDRRSIKQPRSWDESGVEDRSRGLPTMEKRIRYGDPSGAPLLDYWEIPLLEGEEPRKMEPKRGYDPEERRKRAVQQTTNHGGNKESRNDHGEAFYNAGNEHGAPLLDYWEIPPGGYKGSHYAVFPEELVVPCVKAMCPEKVCRTCGEPSRRILRDVSALDFQPDLAAHIRERRTAVGVTHDEVDSWFGYKDAARNWERTDIQRIPPASIWPTLKERLGLDSDFDVVIHGDRQWTESLIEYQHVNNDNSGWTQNASGEIYKRLVSRKNRIYPEAMWTDCGHDDYRPGLVLDPFAGSGTTLSVATGHGHDAIGIDLDPRNADLARDRIGPFLFEETRMQ